MSAPVLTVDEARDPAAEQVISEGLRRYNREQCGISDGRALDVVATSAMATGSSAPFPAIRRASAASS